MPFWISGSNPTAAPTTAPSPTTIQPPSLCNGVPNTDWSCCSSTNPCNLGGGDCDSDRECTTGLTCGDNNCRRDYSTSGSDWGSSADCCTSTYIVNQFVKRKKAWSRHFHGK